jgi:hypothetical protein
MKVNVDCRYIRIVLVERGIDSDEEGAVLPPTTTTHRYNYAVDKVKALANTKGLYDSAPFDRLPLFQRFREYLTESPHSTMGGRTVAMRIVFKLSSGETPSIDP